MNLNSIFLISLFFISSAMASRSEVSFDSCKSIIPVSTDDGIKNLHKQLVQLSVTAIIGEKPAQRKAALNKITSIANANSKNPDVLWVVEFLDSVSDKPHDTLTKGLFYNNPLTEKILATISPVLLARGQKWTPSPELTKKRWSFLIYKLYGQQIHHILSLDNQLSMIDDLVHGADSKLLGLTLEEAVYAYQIFIDLRKSNPNLALDILGKRNFNSPYLGIDLYHEELHFIEAWMREFNSNSTLLRGDIPKQLEIMKLFFDELEHPIHNFEDVNSVSKMYVIQDINSFSKSMMTDVIIQTDEFSGTFESVKNLEIDIQNIIFRFRVVKRLHDLAMEGQETKAPSKLQNFLNEMEKVKAARLDLLYGES
ncbi:MAG TPA: hypothetical protein PLJ21_13235, partial [Pseudobdellovibrionaceae bacterium]|nr:hypothetical protein [Pseudobdellovibrionaceae bacterium]